MKLGVILFNLGGPDGPEAVQPFLFNLFRDPAIIQLPAVARYPLAALISSTRTKVAQANYDIMGGASPLLPETQAQASALEAELHGRGVEARVFIAMRYWKPFAAETARQVAEYGPDEVVLLPLYPQYSTTTTGSSVTDWARRWKGPTRTVCCYPTATGVVEAHAAAIHQAWSNAGKPSNVRLLFSAHGLPQKIVDAGDPYAAQIAATAAAVAQLLPELPDWKVCYQSRVGRLKWLEPSTDTEIRRAGAERKGVLVSPIAFVSEHVETLVELDHEYAELARQVGATPVIRAAAPGVQRAFIRTLADAALDAAKSDEGRRGEGPKPYGPWRCPAGFAKCACRAGEG